MSQLATLHYAETLGMTQRLEVTAGMTVAEIVQSVHGRLDGISVNIRAAAHAGIEWEALPRELWARVKPKVADALMVVFRSQGGNDLFRTLVSVAASVAVLVAAPYLTPLIGTVGTGLLSAGFLLGTSYVANKLFPTAVEATGGVSASIAQESVKAFSTVDSDANVLAKGMSLPMVAGTRRISPPEIASPRGYLNSGVQTLDRIFALGGHHSLTNVQVDSTPVADYDSITTEIKDGAEATSVTTFVNKVTNLVQVGETLSGFSADGVVIEDQVAPSNSEPRYVRFSTRYHKDIEEVAIRVQLDNFVKNGSTAKVRVPMRIRFRLKGTTAWTNLPEMHLRARDQSTHLHEIRLRWDDNFGAFETGGQIEYDFFQRVPEATYALSSGTTGDQWQAAAHFVADTGLNDVQNIAGRRHGLRVTLDPAVNAKGEYEWEIIRGAASDESGFTASTYAISGTIYSFFEGQNISAEWRVPVDQDVYPPRIVVVQATVVVDQLPSQRPGEAILALRSIGQSVRNVTVEAAAYVYDWDGSGWNTLTTSNNPAVHYRQLLFDYLTAHGIDTGLIANDDCVAWRQECIDRGYEISAVFSGTSIGEALASCAEAGFARPAYSIGFGVDWFRDRSAERPAMLFTPRNSSSISFAWNSPEMAQGIRASYKNQDDGYRDAEMQIPAPGYTNFRGYDVATYTSIAKRSLVNRRANFDMLQRLHQGRRIWTVDTAVEGFICNKGTLIKVATDLIDDTAQGARVRQVIDETNLEIDQEIPVQSTTDFYEQENVFDAANLFRVGEQTAMMITTPTGTEMHNIVAAEDRVIRLGTPLSSLDVEGAHLLMAPASDFEHRCIVTNVERRSEERAILTAVDEAPEIYQALLELAA